MYIKYFYLFILFQFSVNTFAQNFDTNSLNKMKDHELLELIPSLKTDSVKAKKVIDVYLYRAKKNKDTLKIAKGYDQFSRLYAHKRGLQYADSVILLTKNIKNKEYPSLGYLIKAQIYNGQGDLKKASENYFKAFEFSVKNENIPYQLFTLGRLIFLKSIWGDKNEALRLQKKRHAIIIKGISNDITKDELTSIFNFSFCYLNLRKLDSAAIYAKNGLRKSSSYKGPDRETIIDFFEEILVEINYYDKKYSESIKGADWLLHKINYKNNLETLQNLYFFKGNSLLKQNKYSEGITYLIKSDSVFEAEGFQIKQPYQRELFDVLLKHYKLEDKPEQQIKYLNKLIAADKVIIKNYQYFEPNLIKNFETPKLIDEKERLITSLTKKNEAKSVTIWWVIGLLACSIFVLGYYFNRQKLYKKRYDALISQTDTIGITNKTHSTKPEISKEIINNIMDSLANFEKNEEYLSKDISIQNMAKSFGTNYKYLSTVINLQKGKRYSNYINDLRVVYAYHKLKKDSKFRKYTIKAISSDCGFKSAESFSKSFYKKFGIYPSFYIKQLNKNEFS